MYDGGYQYMEKITDYVNKYCGGAQQKVDLGRKSNSESENFSLTNARDVQIEHSYKPDKDMFRSDLAFPRMQKLKIMYNMDIDHHFVHLTEFILKSSSYVGFHDLLNFMQMNPLLRRIQLPLFNNGSLFTIINERLPNLESMKFDWHNVDYTGVETTGVNRFRNVKEFALVLRQYNQDWANELQQMFASIQFDRLKTFDLELQFSDAIDFWVEWIAGNTELTKLSLTHVELSFEQLSAIIAPLKKLKVITIAWRQDSTLDNLHRFLSHVATNSSLEHITIDLNYHGPHAKRDSIFAIVPETWTDSQTDAVKKWVTVPHGWNGNQAQVQQYWTRVELKRTN